MTADAAPVNPAAADALGFDLDLARAYVRDSDAALARVVDAVGPCRLQLKTAPSIFGALAEAIVYQQLHARAAATIFGRVCAVFQTTPDGLTAEQILSAPDDDLRAAGLSRSKLLALRDLARRDVDGELPSLADARQMEDEAIVEQLTRVRGVGRWTAEMLLIFRLGRPDVLPVDDYGVRKGFAFVTGRTDPPPPKELAAYGERWRPYRTVASWYLWRAVELAKV